MHYNLREDAVTGEVLYSGVHKSGARIFVMPKPGFRKCMAMFATGYGSIDTTYKKDGEVLPIPDGTAHFLEHKLFEEENGNVFDRFSMLGANANAFTSFATTAYYFTSTDHFFENLETLISFVQNPYFTDESIAKEQGIIGQEIKMYDDDPGWQVHFRGVEALYHNHPVKIDIAGTVESIAQINERTLYDIYNMYYHPSNMVLFIAGDVVPEQVFIKAEETLKDVGPLPEKIERVLPPEPKSVVKSKTEMKLDVAVPMFQISFKDNDTNVTGKDFLKKEILTDMLLELMFGKSALIYRELYNSGLINNSFSADYSGHRDYAFATVGAESKQPYEAYDKLMSLLESSEITVADFERVKKCVWGDYIDLFDSTESVVYSFALHQLIEVDMFDFKEVYDAITFEDLCNRRQVLLRKENSCLSVIMPKE